MKSTAADLSRVLGEAIVLFERARSVRWNCRMRPRVNLGTWKLAPKLYVLGTRNTADRTIARMDIAIRRRFAFVEVWPDRAPIDQEDVQLARDCFDDTVHTFTEYRDAETLRLTPGQAYFLDPRPINRETVARRASPAASSTSCCRSCATISRSVCAAAPPRRSPAWPTASSRGCCKAHEPRPKLAAAGRVPSG